MRIYEKDFAMVAVDEATGILLSVAKLIETSGNVAFAITGEQLEFLRTEFALDAGDIHEFKSNTDTANYFIRGCFAIEAEEVAKLDDKGPALSRRGEIAVQLIDLLYNSAE